MVELFEQEPWQPFFNQDDDPIPNPIFEDFERPTTLTTVERVVLAEQRRGGRADCGASARSAARRDSKHVTIMRHKLSGILVAVGGNCAAHMVGAHELNEMIGRELNGRSEYDSVGQILGWW